MHITRRSAFAIVSVVCLSCQGAMVTPHPGPMQPDGGNGGSEDRGATTFVARPNPPVAISEIMYHPIREDAAEDDHEFIELFNTTDADVSLAGWQLLFSGRSVLTFSAGAVIVARTWGVVARNREALLEVERYRLDPSVILGAYDRSLDNGGEKIRLIDAAGTAVDAVEYDDRSPWTLAADALGAGESWLPASSLPLERHRFMGVSLERMSFDEAGDQVFNWGPSPLDGATPGRRNRAAGVPRPVVEDVQAAPASGDGPIRAGQPVAVSALFTPQAAGMIRGVQIEYFVDDVAHADEPHVT